MNLPIYVIKSQLFGYNDEYMEVYHSKIHSSYTKLSEAIEQYQTLEIQAARRIDYLDLMPSIFYSTKEFRQALVNFIKSKTGAIFNLERFQEIPQCLPKSLSDEDVLNFISLANINSYQLVSFNQSPKFYALWLLRNNQYLIRERDESYSLVYHSSPDELFEELEVLGYDYDEQDNLLKGELNELSDQPILLKQLIQTNSELNYDDQTKELKIRGTQTKTYIQLNSLLKRPWFEIRELNLEQVVKIEENLEAEYQKDLRRFIEQINRICS
ncbi:MAG: hypothetical protein AB4058_20515 [Microcystaceae cyanobacterium]